MRNRIKGATAKGSPLLQSHLMKYLTTSKSWMNLDNECIRRNKRNRKRGAFTE